MRPGVHIAKTDDRALGLQARLADTRRPIRLQHQPHGPGWHAVNQLIKQRLRLNAQRIGPLRLTQAELLLEPANHPEAAINHHLSIEMIGNSRGVRRNQRHGFQIAAAGGVDRCCGAIRQTGSGRLNAARAEHFAGFVRTRRNQRQPFGNTGMTTGFGADMAEQFPGLAQLRQLFTAHGDGLPFPVAGFGPLQAFVIERQIGHATGQGINKLPTQAMGEKA